MTEILAANSSIASVANGLEEEKNSGPAISPSSRHHHHHGDGHRKKKDDKKSTSRRRKHDKQQAAATKIQSLMRGYLVRLHYLHHARSNEDTIITKKLSQSKISSSHESNTSMEMSYSIQGRDSMTIVDNLVLTPRSTPLSQNSSRARLIYERNETELKESEQEGQRNSGVTPGDDKKELIVNDGSVNLKKTSPTQRLPPVSNASQTNAELYSEASQHDVEYSSSQQNINLDRFQAQATKIQATFRGHEGRLEMQRTREAVENQLKREVEEEVKREEHAATEVQALFRGHRVRECLHSVDKMVPISVATQSRPNTRALAKNAEGKSKPTTTQLTKSTSDAIADSKQGAKLENNEDDAKTNAKTSNDEENKSREWPKQLQLDTHLDVSSDTTEEISKRGSVRVYILTWNLQAQKPPTDLRAILRPGCSHIYAIGTEECVQSIAKSVLFQSKKEWEDLLKDSLGHDYLKLRSHALTAMHNVVFVHKNVMPLVSQLHSDAIATGLGNQLGNKGGVGIAFCVGLTSFAFIGSHFEAHQSQQALQRRNANFHRINNELQLVDSKDDHRKGPISDTFDRVFWCGDLNYRIDGNRRMIDDLLQRNFHDVLLVNDQLRKEIYARRVFQNFLEGPLHFRPTYKFDKGCDLYDSSPKQRIPSWTDRILYKSIAKAGIILRSYESHMEIKTSDHRPVSSVFDVQFMSELKQKQHQPLPDQSKSEVCSLQ